jgi:LacI family transcriptional regulator
VVTDDVAVGRVVARHLLDKGYQYMAFWGHHDAYAQQRWTGFAAEVVAARGAARAPARAPVCDRAARLWLAALPRPLGLMTANDSIGLSALRACHALGWRVPQDVAVVGVDDDEVCSDLSTPPLSSVALRNEQIGRVACEALLRLLRGRKVRPVTLIPPGPLLGRQSSRGVAGNDPVVTESVRFMEQHLAERFGIPDVAGSLLVSRRILELRFRAVLGRSPAQELRWLRVDHARSLLATGTLPLERIARLTGLGSHVRLCQIFRHHTGQTPTAYRRSFLSD